MMMIGVGFTRAALKQRPRRQRALCGANDACDDDAKTTTSMTTREAREPQQRVARETVATYNTAAEIHEFNGKR